MGKNKATSKNGLKKQKALRFYKKKRWADAETAYLGLCESDPADAEAHHMLGLVYACTGRFADAERLFEQAIRLQPDAADIHYVLGGARGSLGKLSAAAESFSETIRLAPDMAEAHLELGNVLFGQERMEEAKRAYREAVRLKPALAAGHFQLGLANEALGIGDEAIACYKSAVACDPKLSLAYCQLGGLLVGRGCLDEAQECFRAAQRLHPGLAYAIAGEAGICEHRRDYQGAYTLLAPLLNQEPKNLTVGLVFARICSRFGRCNEAAEYLESVLRQGNLQDVHRVKVHFGLGRLYDRMQRYDEAFSNFRQGNELKSQFLNYQVVEETAQVERQIRTFTPEAAAHLPRSRIAERRMIFIVGMPRSGTSLTEQILASHPEVYGGGELLGISDVIGIVPSLASSPEGYPAALQHLSAESLDALAQMYLDRLDSQAPAATRITDKMPHNFQHLGLINLLFPEARVVHCIRDARDTCLSIYTQNFSDGHPYSTNLAALGRHYRLYEKLMRHWKGVVSLPILDFHYEDTVNDFERQARRLVEFCGLPWDDACLRFHESKRDVGTSSYAQVQQPLYSQSVGRWHHYERHLNDLQSALVQDV